MEFAQNTKRNGRTLFQDPLIRDTLTQLAIEGEAARLLALRIVWRQSTGKSVDHEASMSRVFGAEFQQRVAQAGLQITGAFGQLDEDSEWAPLSGFFQRQYLYAAAATVGAGTAEIQRNIIALRGLGLPRS